MRSKISVFFILLFLTSCRIVTFDKLPGTVLPSFPKTMQGRYLEVIKNNGVKDSQIITINEKAIYSNKYLSKQLINIYDSSYVISQLNEFYFVNIPVSDSSMFSKWMVLPFLFDKKYLYIYEYELNKKTIRRLNRFGIKNIHNSENYFKMNDIALEKYSKKYCKKRKAKKFKRIN